MDELNQSSVFWCPLELVVVYRFHFDLLKLVFLYQLKLEAESAANTWFRINPDLAIVLIHDVFGDH